MLAARAIDEIHLFIDLNGYARRSHAMVMSGDELAAQYVCVDRDGCERVLLFEPVSEESVDSAMPPSRLIDAGQWLAISDAASRTRETLPRAISALEQVLAFAGTDEITDAAFFTEQGRAYREQQDRSTFRRLRLEARLAAYRRRLAAPAPVARSQFNWLAAFVFGFFGFMIGLGIALGLSAGPLEHQLRDVQGPLVLGSGAVLGAAVFWLSGTKLGRR